MRQKDSRLVLPRLAPAPSDASAPRYRSRLASEAASTPQNFTELFSHDVAVSMNCYAVDVKMWIGGDALPDANTTRFTTFWYRCVFAMFLEFVTQGGQRGLTVEGDFNFNAKAPDRFTMREFFHKLIANNRAQDIRTIITQVHLDHWNFLKTSQHLPHPTASVITPWSLDLGKCGSQRVRATRLCAHDPNTNTLCSLMLLRVM